MTDNLYWWSGEPNEIYWLEATSRPKIGEYLLVDFGGADRMGTWQSSLFMETHPGDIVFHFQRQKSGGNIIGYSRVGERHQHRILLTGYTALPNPISLEEIRKQTAGLREIDRYLRNSYGPPLHWPFRLYPKRPIQLLSGYSFKLPTAFLGLFPELANLINHPVGKSLPEKRRNPSWLRDELILALDLYLSNPASPPGKTSQPVKELSALLNKIGRRLHQGSRGDYRNPNGVYMKMMNFRRFDPTFIASGRVGLTRGNKEEESVWREFAGDRSRLSRVASAIREAVNSSELDWDEDMGGQVLIQDAPEGRVLTLMHRRKERSRRLVEERKRQALSQSGQLSCEACGFDFEVTYGERGRGVIEAHHIKPVYTLSSGSRTRLEDLALVCANCHRIIHSTRPWLTMDGLRELLAARTTPP